jgi:hypothetical protein
MEERKGRFLTPPHSTYSQSSLENTESGDQLSNGNLPPGLEGVGMDPNAPPSIDRKDKPWLGQTGVMYWGEDEKERIKFTTGEYCITPYIAEQRIFIEEANRINSNNLLTFQLLRQALRQCPSENEGWCFAVALLTLRGFTPEFQEQVLKQPYQLKTFKGYCYGWKKVALFVKENDHPCSFYGPVAVQQFYIDFIMWIQDPHNKRITPSTVKMVKTSLSTLLQVTFGYDPTESTPITY